VQPGLAVVYCNLGYPFLEGVVLYPLYPTLSINLDNSDLYLSSIIPILIAKSNQKRD